MASQIDICNFALSRIGRQDSIASLNEGSPEANALSLVWGATLDALLRAHPWCWARRQIAATLLAAAKGTPENPSGTGSLPPVPWSYQYAFPNDCVSVRQVLQTNLGSIAIPYILSGDQDSAGNPIKTLLTNQSQAILVYTARVDSPTLWDSEFVAAMVTALAAAVAFTLTGDMALVAMMEKVAATALLTARVSDEGEAPNSGEVLPSWLSARGYSSNDPTLLNAVLTGG